MTEDLVLYRKYRPSSFAEVRDQEHIVSVLEGAIAKEQIPHALLFSGTRGTGKTTLARIFASALGTQAVDIYEMDAASNRGIDEIRELKEAAYTLPLQSKYKVYIIDEVHMLTPQAFNAFLKILEEPPAHVVFILATTEEDKLLDTVLSRCLVFHFRSPSKSVLTALVTDVAKQEGFALEPAAADLIATAADSSFRDALGVTQKVILASGDQIGSADEVAAILGAPTEATLVALLKALNEKNTNKALDLLTKCQQANVDSRLFNRLLLENLRLILRLRHEPAKQAELLADTGDATRVVLLEISQDTKTILNSKALSVFLEAAMRSASAPLPYLPLEIAIYELTSSE